MKIIGKLVHFLIVFWGNAVLFFKSPIEAGIVFKTILFENPADWHTAKNGIFAGMQPFFCNILMDGDADIVFKRMGNIKLADIKLLCQMLQRQVCIQVIRYIITNIQIQGFL